MTKKRRLKVIAGLALAMVLVVAFSLSAFAASEKVEDVIARLEQLQRSDISPAWEPDVRANQSHVQALLDGFTALSAAEKAELSESQLADLRAYFETLYAVQGKDAAGLDAIFAGGGEAEESSSVPASSEVDSSSEEDSSVSVSLPVVPAPVSSAPVAGSGEEVSSAPVHSLPQAADDDGLLSLFGSKALGTGLLVVLLILVLVLFVRFLVALRRNRDSLHEEKNQDERAKELFGENYDPEGLQAEETPTEEEVRPSLMLGAQPSPLAPLREKPVPGERQDDPFAQLPPAEAEEELQSGGWFGRKKREEPAAQPREPLRGRPLNPPEEEAPAPAPAPTYGQETAAPPSWSAPGTAAAQTQANVQELLEEKKAAAKKSQPRPEIGANPDKQNSITMRSFSAPARTGRPGKMPFRQGDPEDLDAIDE